MLKTIREPCPFGTFAISILKSSSKVLYHDFFCLFKYNNWFALLTKLKKLKKFQPFKNNLIEYIEVLQTLFLIIEKPDFSSFIVYVSNIQLFVNKVNSLRCSVLTKTIYLVYLDIQLFGLLRHVNTI